MTGPALPSCVFIAAATISPGIAAAQAVASPDQVIVVTAPRSLPPPQRELRRQDIDSYGASSIGELLGEVLDEEGEDAPVVLINGRRASGLEELSDYPPEALERLEVLPTGSGPSVGASPTRKVVNLVLSRWFDGQIGRASFRTATDGGFQAVRADGTFTRIRGPSRLNLTLRGRAETALTEAERDLAQLPGSLPGEAEARTLLPSVRGSDLSLSGATRLGSAVDLSGTGRLSFTNRDGGLGLSPLGIRREQQSRLLGGKLNTSLNAEAGGWTLAMLGTLDADRRRVDTDLNSGLQRSLATSLDLTATRPLFALPAGQLQLNLGAALATEHFRSEVRRSGTDATDRFSERTVTATAGLLVPISGGPEKALAPLGELNLSVDAGVGRTSGVGAFSTASLGLVWQPLPWARLNGGWSRASSPPSARFRREAALVTPGVLVVDPLTGESVRVDEINGPLTARVRPRSTHQRLALTLSPPSKLNLRLESEWSRRQERNPVGDLPLASAAILAAFPERFVRDPSGRLTAIDVSPLLFARRSETQLRNAINLRLFLGSAAPATSSNRGDGAEEGEGEERARRGGRPRLQLGLAHTLLLSSRLTLREGLPPLDLLSREALLFAGGRPRHQFDLSANLSRPGMGLRLAASHRSGSRTVITGVDGRPQELRFGALGTVTLRAFADADRLLGANPLTRGTRISLTFNNLLNAREDVRDGARRTPLAYQPAYRDALGRTIELEVRRRF